VRDKNDHANWTCQNCGVLADVDANPEVNPFSPGDDFKQPEKKKTAIFRRRKQETVAPGKTLKMVQATIKANPGLSVSEALTLVRNALVKYPEN
jgi:hypothetical protein